jgi:hypothetical protein
MFLRLAPAATPEASGAHQSFGQQIAPLASAITASLEPELFEGLS